MFVLGLQDAELGVRAQNVVSCTEIRELHEHCSYTLLQSLCWSHGAISAEDGPKNVLSRLKS